MRTRSARWAVAMLAACVAMAGGALRGADAPPAAKPVTLDLDAVPLDKAIDGWQAASGERAEVAWRALARLGVDRQASVTLHLRQAPAEAGLRLILRAARPAKVYTPTAWRDATGAWRVIGADDGTAPPEERAYDLDKMSLANIAQPDGGDSERALVKALTDTVAPGVWAEQGGTLGRMRVAGTSLVVWATPAVQAQVAEALARLQTALAEPDPTAAPIAPPGGRETPEIKMDVKAGPKPKPPAADPDAPDAAARKALAGPLPADGWGAGTMELSAALAKWQAATGANVFVDWAVIQAAGIKPKAEVDVPGAGRPAGDALGFLLAGAGQTADRDPLLAYEVSPAGVVIVSTAADLQHEDGVVRCYNVRGPLAGASKLWPADAAEPERLAAIVKAVREWVAPQSWGRPATTGTFGPVLIVGQTPREQERVGRMVRAGF